MSDRTEAKIRESSDNCDAGPDCIICSDVRPLLRLLDEARAERDALRKDAERYRWLRGRCEDYDGHATFPDVAYPAPIPDAPGFSRVDDAIDTAMECRP